MAFPILKPETIANLSKRKRGVVNIVKELGCVVKKLVMPGIILIKSVIPAV